jgi:phosphoenolpyruvate phosphomutase
MMALILNSGTGKRMGGLTKDKPKCMTEITRGETILSRQLRQLCAVGIKTVVITTGEFDSLIKSYCFSIELPLTYNFVHNNIFAETNYIYSMHLASELLIDDIILMHGDLVFEDNVLEHIATSKESCMTVCSRAPLPEKDFKAVVINKKIVKVGVDFFDRAITAQPLYKLMHADMTAWMERIAYFCENGKTDCYAENALNEITDKINLLPLDIKNSFCTEIDTLQDLRRVKLALVDNV